MTICLSNCPSQCPTDPKCMATCYQSCIAEETDCVKSCHSGIEHAFRQIEPLVPSVVAAALKPAAAKPSTVAAPAALTEAHYQYVDNEMSPLFCVCSVGMVLTPCSCVALALPVGASSPLSSAASRKLTRTMSSSLVTASSRRITIIFALTTWASTRTAWR